MTDRELDAGDVAHVGQAGSSSLGLGACEASGRGSRRWRWARMATFARMLSPRSRVPGSGVRGRGSGERETTASSLAGKEESSRKEDNSGQGKDGPAGAIAQGGNGR